MMNKHTNQRQSMISTSTAPLVLQWMRIWHWFNLITLTDLAYVILRPASLEGGSLAFMFPLYNYYASKDRLFLDYHDRAVKSIYILGIIDAFFLFYLLYAYAKSKNCFKFALLCLIREVFVMTKTAIYVMYSYHHIVPNWRLFITLLNGSWVYLPFFAIIAITNHLGNQWTIINNKLKDVHIH